MHSAGTIARGNWPLESLVQAMAAGDAAAFSSLYEQSVGQLFAIARGILRCQEDAEEVVCDVYTHAWRCAATYDSCRGSVMAWLSIITRNRSLDRLRQRRTMLSLDDVQHHAVSAALTDAEPGPEQLLSQTQAGSAVHRALMTLTPQRRRLVELAFFQGLSHQEIADAVGMPLGTVKSHLRRALAALQGALAG
jgi:RNA polymerase sigma-70 factor (ECF subfamily)